MNKKLLVICGPTATGKTSLGVKLAKKLDGEIISADSRQVYKGMDIVTGKDVENSEFRIQNSELHRKIQKQVNSKITLGTYEINKVPLWGLDLVEPDQKFSAAHWVKFSCQVIEDIWKRKKLAIIIGGTGFWIKSLINCAESLGVSPDWKLRKKLSNYSIALLLHCLKKLNPERVRRMNKSDKNNPRRLIRAIEVARNENHQPSRLQKLCFKHCGQATINHQQLPIKDLLTIGLKTNNKLLYKKIDKRVEKRIVQGAEKEIRDLVGKGYSWDLPSMSALGCKEWRDFLRLGDSRPLNTALRQKIVQQWKYNEHAYARRQMTWFNKDTKIKWFDIQKTGWCDGVVKLVKTWYYKNDGKN